MKSSAALSNQFALAVDNLGNDEARTSILVSLSYGGRVFGVAGMGSKARPAAPPG